MTVPESCAELARRFDEAAMGAVVDAFIARARGDRTAMIQANIRARLAWQLAAEYRDPVKLLTITGY